MKTVDLNTLKRPHTEEECRKVFDLVYDIFNKIEYSGISKEAIKNKLIDLETRQVPNREVLLYMQDEDVVFYWFKNWLHPQLKSFFPRSPNDKSGCSKAVLKRDARLDSLQFYENGQQNYSYTLADMWEYCHG